MLIQQWSGVVCIDPTLGQFFLQQCRSIYVNGAAVITSNIALLRIKATFWRLQSCRPSLSELYYIKRIILGYEIVLQTIGLHNIN